MKPYLMAVVLTAATSLFAQTTTQQHDPHQHGTAPQTPQPQAPQPQPMDMQMPMDMPMHHEMHDATHEFLMQQASGTSVNPAAAPDGMVMTEAAGWNLMFHGEAFVNATRQTGPRGGDKLFSTNWIMGMADRKFGPGRLMLRSMLSLEPATITDKSYPELFQTGETAYGQPLRDAQHPHDFFMELAAEYAQPLAGGIGYVYLAPVGDPSLGPVAYPHRVSAMEIPQATLGHHVQDSTHLANNVITAGYKRGIFGAAVSAFHGGEPDEDRWDIDGGSIDSWAVRLTADPTPNWTAQVSTGHLKKPEALEEGDVQRTTASVTYSAPSILGWISTSLIYGHNTNPHGSGLNSWLAESVATIAKKNYVTARIEFVDKNELFSGEPVPPAISEGTFNIHSLLVGYTRDVWTDGKIVAGVGGNITTYSFPSDLKPYYGSHPRSYYVFARLRNVLSGSM